jgi:hypothetical protein
VPDYHPNGGREQIHVTGPSLLPLATAVGFTLALVGLVLSWWFVVAGGAVLLISVVRWIRTARVEFDSLPSERR